MRRWGLGWEGSAWLDGMEVARFTYLQQSWFHRLAEAYGSTRSKATWFRTFGYVTFKA
ncbi:MAG: glycine--tRNA ligase subunit alpha [Veillonella atypica]